MTETTALVSADQTLKYNERQVKLIRETVAPQLDDTQFATFMLLAARTGLDPLSRQIYAIPRKKRVKENGEWVDKTEMTLQTGIDGFRAIGQRTRECTGVSAPEWCDKKGVWRDVWLEEEPPAAARVTVYRNGEAYPFVATYREYVQTVGVYEGEGRDRKQVRTEPNSMWKNMPANQIAKCAEAGAWRKAFPVEMGGIFVDEEEAGINYVIEVEGQRNDAPGRKPPQVPQVPQRTSRTKQAAAVQHANQPEAEPFRDDEPIDAETRELPADGLAPWGTFWNELQKRLPLVPQVRIAEAIGIEAGIPNLKKWYEEHGATLELIDFVADAIDALGE